MITLCMETSHKHLMVAILKDYKVISVYQDLCLKKQSEIIFDKLSYICDKANVKPMDINEVFITRGPGSYTGVRIAMSIAKVMCSLRDIPLYTIDTLKLYSGSNENSAVIMDARSNRAYYGEFSKGETIVDTCVLEIDEIKEKIKGKKLYGDLSILGLEDNYVDMAQAFIDMKSYMTKIENIHTLTPEYLKEASEYFVKK